MYFIMQNNRSLKEGFDYGGAYVLDLPQVHLFFILDLSPSKSAFRCVYGRIFSELAPIDFPCFFCLFVFVLNMDLFTISDAILLGG